MAIILLRQSITRVVNEDHPTKATKAFDDFMSMSEDDRIESAEKMSEEQKGMILMDASQSKENILYENLIGIGQQILLSGNFIGVGDGIHNAKGKAKVITLEDGSKIVRLENFRSTNGPDLYIYLATDKHATDFISLGTLKSNVGNQNYSILEEVDLSKYDTALIWCKAFLVLFGSAELKQTS